MLMLECLSFILGQFGLTESPAKMKPVLAVVAYINIAVAHVKHNGIVIRPCHLNAHTGKAHVSGKFVLGVLLCLTSTLSATSVIAIRTASKTIVLGGDSKVNGPHSGLACKTNVANNVAYGYGGILSVSKVHFAISDIVRRNLKGGGNLATRVNAVEREVAPQIVELLTKVKQDDPLGYEKKLSGQVALEIVFAAVEEHIPKMMVFYLKAETAPAKDGRVVLKAQRYSCPGDCPDGTAYIALGFRDAADEDFAKHPSMVAQLGVERTVRHLIEDEVIDSPNDVGLPITIIRLSDNGIEWVEDSEQCKNDRESESKGRALAPSSPSR